MHQKAELTFGGPLSDDTRDRLLAVLARVGLPVLPSEGEDLSAEEPPSTNDADFYEEQLDAAIAEERPFTVQAWMEEDSPARAFEELLQVVKDLGLTWRMLDAGGNDGDGFSDPQPTASISAGGPGLPEGAADQVSVTEDRKLMLVVETWDDTEEELARLRKTIRASLATLSFTIPPLTLTRVESPVP